MRCACDSIEVQRLQRREQELQNVLEKTLCKKEGKNGHFGRRNALVRFTRSLASNLVKRKIRVNGVWTPLIASTFKPEKVSDFGSDVPMGRAAEPAEIAPSFRFLASDDAAFITGQVIHPNGGEIVNG